MSASNACETGLLNLIYVNANFALIGDATGLRGSTAAGSLYVTLHTADPGEAGTQLTSETVYTNYARQAVVRSGAGWTVAGNTVTNAAAITFPVCGVTGATITHFGVGTDAAGAGTLLFKGTCSIVVANGTPAPTFAIGALSNVAD